MAMAIQVICPTCGKSFDAPEQFAGREDHCPACRTPVTIPKEQPKFAPAPPPAKEPTAMEKIALDLDRIRFRLGCLIALGIGLGILLVMLINAERVITVNVPNQF